VADGQLKGEPLVLVCFLRHGKADPRSKPDEQRQLLDEGREQLRSAASTWRRLNLRPDVVVTSPRQRSIDSAQLFIVGIGVDLVPTIAAKLAPGAEPDAFVSLFAGQPDDATVVFVGHEPDLSEAAEYLSGATAIRLREGGLVCLELRAGVKAGSGVLTTLLDPALYEGR
jgi:phosphohistidine phosphatase